MASTRTFKKLKQTSSLDNSKLNFFLLFAFNIFNAQQKTVSIKISSIEVFPFLVVFRITEEIDYLSMIKPQGKALEIAPNFDSILV